GPLDRGTRAGALERAGEAPEGVSGPAGRVARHQLVRSRSSTSYISGGTYAPGPASRYPTPSSTLLARNRRRCWSFCAHGEKRSPHEAPHEEAAGQRPAMNDAPTCGLTLITRGGAAGRREIH